MIVEKADYNSADNYIDFECAVPVKIGKMTQDPFYWPADLPISERWPPQEDIDNGDAGGGGIGGGASGNLPVGEVSGIGAVGMIFVGGPNVIYGPQSDWGDRTPTDVGFVAQSTPPASFNYSAATGMPSLTMEMDFLEDYGPLPQLNTPAPLTIDLNTTQVLDSSGENKQLYGYLRDVLALDDNGRVAIDLHETEIIDKATNGTAKLDDIFIIQESTLSGTTMDYSQPAIRLPPPTADGTNVLMINGDEVEFVTTDQPAGAPFDFKFDTNGGKMGAGTAFLQD